MEWDEKCIYNYLKLIDKISNALELPNIRKYTTYIDDPDLFKYLSELGYTRLIYHGATNYLYISYEMFSNNIDDIFIDPDSVDAERYYAVEDILKGIPIEEILNMTDEEFELVLRLN